ncbi:MAG: hypothetical protein ACI4XB_04030 [Ruminococcus sp.]
MFRQVDEFAEIELAKQEIHHLKLDQRFSNQDCICELYCIPSLAHLTYYMQVYCGGDGYEAIYARTIVQDNLGNIIHTHPFCWTKAAASRPDIVGKIVCGYCCLSEKSAEKLSCVLKMLPEGIFRDNESGVMLDGVRQVIRQWEHGALRREFCGCTSAEKPEGVSTELWKNLCDLNEWIEMDIDGMS